MSNQAQAIASSPANIVSLPSTTPWDALWAEYVRSLKARRHSPLTIQTYSEAGAMFRGWLREHGLACDPVQVNKGQIEQWLIDLQERRNKRGEPISARTIRSRYSAIRSFYGYLVAEGEVERSPMPAPPEVHESDRPVLTDDEVRALLKITDGRDFESRRDHALIRLAVDSGLRRAELARLTVASMDLETHEVRVLVKGGRTESAYWGDACAAALDRYLRVRARHQDATRPELWLGVRGGALSPIGVHKMVRRRLLEAGIVRDLGGLGSHTLRHFFNQELDEAGASDQVKMKLGRWRDPRSMARYARGSAQQRARAWHAENAPGDRL